MIVVPGQTFERDMVHAWNDYFTRSGSKGVAYRHYQMRYHPQLFDVLIDTRGNELYSAIECKSVDTKSVEKLYFKKHFSWQKGICQVERENEWLVQSGRNGWLVVELRRGPGKRTEAYYVPWGVVWYSFRRGAVALEPEQITYYPSIVKRSGKYLIDEDFVAELVKRLDTSGRDAKRSFLKRK